SQLTGWDIDIVTEQEESEHRQAEFEKRTKLFIEALNVDEVVGQLLASEGFNSVEELAAVDEKELAGIEGFDEATARELQTRTREYLDRQEAELDDKRKQLGVEDALKEIPGVTTAMLVKLGENGIKTVEDLAGCATDDLFGWSERKDGETIRYPGALDGFDLSRDETEALIMQARVKAGWIKEEDLAPPPAEEGTAEATPAPAGGHRMLGRSHDDALDAGPHKRTPGTQRFCAASGAVRSVDEMIRFVVGPDGTAVPDLKRRLPGRGIWIMATRQALRSAITRKAFARAFKRDVRLTPDLVETTERLIERAALDALAICHKAGKLPIGFANADAG